MPHLSFKTPEPLSEPLTFDIDGERFECEPDIDAVRYFRGTARALEMGNEGIVDFLYDVVIDDDLERLAKTIKERIIPASTIAEVYRALVGVYGGNRPTRPSSGS